MTVQELSDELVAMMLEQKEVVLRTGAGAIGPVSVEEKREQREVFVRHADRLGELLANASWPTAAHVGEEAARAAWLIAQHADTQVHIQRLAVGLLRTAVENGEASPQHLAFLEDRLAMNEGRFQVYGTQIADVIEGRPIPWPCIEPEQLDARRAQVGIEPFAENIARYSSPGHG
jgi:hypothetical protein